MSNLYISIEEAEQLVAPHVNEILTALSTENKYGSKYVCQLHPDSNASLHVYKNENNVRLHCFGCQFHGSIFDYVAQLKKIDKVSAADWCLKTVGINHSVMTISNDDVAKLEELNKHLALMLRRSIERLNPNAVEFLKGKGLYDKQLLQSECIGQIAVPDQLMKWATKKYGREFIDKMRPINLALFGPNKLTYTIFNKEGKPVAFAARKLDNSLPKYVNSNGNVYDKRSTPYGIHRLIPNREVIIVEGYNDALAFWKLGIRNAIALCGTSLSKELIDILLKLNVPRVHLFFDSDNAGLKATYESIMKLKSFIDLDIWLASTDPDELILRYGRNFMSGIQMQSMLEFILYYTQDPEFTISLLDELAVDKLEAEADVLCNALKNKFNIDCDKYRLLYDVMRRKYNRDIASIKSRLNDLSSSISAIEFTQES